MPRWSAPDLPLGATVNDFVSNHDAGQRFLERATNAFGDAMKAGMSLPRPATASGPPAGGATITLTVERTGARAAFQLAFRRFDQRVQPLHKAFTARWEVVTRDQTAGLTRLQKEEAERLARCGGDAECQTRVSYDYCLKYRAFGDRAYAELLPIWARYWPPTRQAIEDYYNSTSGPLAAIADRAERDQLDNFRKAALWRHYSYAATFLQAWRGFGAQCVLRVCNQPAPPVPHDVRPPDASGGPPCPLGVGLSLGLGPFSLSLDCEKAKLGASAGLEVAYERNFVDHSNTYYVGAGVRGSAGFAEAGMGAGVYFTERGGSITDFGGYADAGLGAGPAGVELGARISAVSGAADFSAGLELGPINVGL